MDRGAAKRRGRDQKFDIVLIAANVAGNIAGSVPDRWADVSADVARIFAVAGFAPSGPPHEINGPYWGREYTSSGGSRSLPILRLRQFHRYHI